MATVRRELSQLWKLPLVLRCVVIGAVVVGTAAAGSTVVGWFQNYPSDDFGALCFGLFEGFALGGVLGACLGVLVGLPALLIRWGLHAAGRRG